VVVSSRKAVAQGIRQKGFEAIVADAV